jgi:YegS/Rv2252/BmrU family lipid kinase
VDIAVIINPISGTGRNPETARRRAELAAQCLAARSVRGEIIVTERPGHARDLTAALAARGVSTVVAWGGDGTVNEVASTLAGRSTVLAVVPSGSGNGLARELAIPFDARAALDVAVTGPVRRIDCGELDGRTFVNIAGLGIDAVVAHQFAAHGLRRRGFLRYLEITARELARFVPDDHTIMIDGAAVRQRTLIVAIANARQYGNGALIAPRALLDDGKLDVVVVGHRPMWQTLLQVPRLFTGRIGSVPGVFMTTALEVEITSTRPALCHVDGEPFVGGVTVRARVRAGSLLVRVPAR